MDDISKVFKLVPGDKRHSPLPASRPELYSHYETQRNAFWTEKTVNFKDDYNNFLKMPMEERNMLIMLHVLFTRADHLADNVFSTKYGLIKEAMYDLNLVLNYQAMMENIHEIGYERALQMLVGDDKALLDKIHADFDSYTLIANLYRWVDKYTNCEKAQDFPRAILAMALFEGVLFSGAFAIILYYADKLKGVGDLNKYIARDEGKHHTTSFILYSYLHSSYRLSPDTARTMVSEFVSEIREFFYSIIPRNVHVIYYENVIRYIEYMADYTLVSMGYEKLYRAEQPFSHMEVYAHPIIANLHERKSQSYTMATDSVELNNPSTLGRRPQKK